MNKIKLLLLLILILPGCAANRSQFQASLNDLNSNDITIRLQSNNLPVINREIKLENNGQELVLITDHDGFINIPLSFIPPKSFLSDEKQILLKLKGDNQLMIIDLRKLSFNAFQEWEFIRQQVQTYVQATEAAGESRVSDALRLAKTINRQYFPYQDKLIDLDRKIDAWYKREYLDAYNHANRGDFQSGIMEMQKISSKSPFYNQAAQKVNEWERILLSRGQIPVKLVPVSEPVVMQPDFTKKEVSDNNLQFLKNQQNFKLAQAYRQQYQYQLALAFFEKALVENPDNYEIIKGLADTHNDLENMTEAIHWYRNALKLSPGNQDLIQDLAKSYHALGDIDNALYFYNQLLQLNGTDRGIIYYYQGNLHKMAGNQAQAIFAYKMACDLKIAAACQSLESYRSR